MDVGILQKLFYILKAIKANGIAPGMQFAVALLFNRTTEFRPKGFAHPLLIRANTSDVWVAFDHFVKGEYQIPGTDTIKVIFDLGGNVGYSAAFLSHHYPNAKIISIEPNKTNFEALCKNTKPYPNIVPVNQGVWWRAANLDVINPEADAWEFQLAEVAEGGTPCIAIDDLFKTYCEEGQAAMVKMDIEGAEKEIFRETSDWISKTAFIQIEIHECWKEVFDRLAHFDYQASISSENVVIDLTAEQAKRALRADTPPLKSAAV